MLESLNIVVILASARRVRVMGRECRNCQSMNLLQQPIMIPMMPIDGWIDEASGAMRPEPRGAHAVVWHDAHSL